jgi:predicted XRE-type DNA-binding protein
MPQGDHCFAAASLDEAALSLIALKHRLAAEIVQAIEVRALPVREAARQTGLPAADFSRLRGRRVERFSVDRLLTVLLRFDCDIDIKIMHASPPLMGQVSPPISP